MAEMVIQLPPLARGQSESWAALIELAPVFGDNWLLVGGQMVFLHEVERQATEIRPTIDVDVVVNLRAEPGGHLRDFDSLACSARTIGPRPTSAAANRNCSQGFVSHRS